LFKLTRKRNSILASVSCSIAETKSFELYLNLFWMRPILGPSYVVPSLQLTWVNLKDYRLAWLKRNVVRRSQGADRTKFFPSVIHRRYYPKAGICFHVGYQQQVELVDRLISRIRDLELKVVSPVLIFQVLEFLFLLFSYSNAERNMLWNQVLKHSLFFCGDLSAKCV